MTDPLATLLNSLPIEGLALDKQPNGYTACIFLGLEGAAGKWTERVWASSASEAIEKALESVPRPVVLAPPPY